MSLVITDLLSQAGRLLLMTLLLGASACCSGSETAFFSLSRRHIERLRRSRPRLGHIVAGLLDRPGDLLGTLLLANLVVNILFFATASVLMWRLEEQAGWLASLGLAVGSFLALVVVGEVLPKSLAYAHPEGVCRGMALPLLFLVRSLSPLVRLIRVLVTEPGLRLILGGRSEPERLSPDAFQALIHAGRHRGWVTPAQGRLFTDVTDLHLLRVRHVMTPRVDLVACELRTSPVHACGCLRRCGRTSLFVYDGTLDALRGTVSYRDLLLHPEASLGDLLTPILFVPEQKTVESLLSFFRKMRVDTAAVVDEYGGVAGAVQIEDVARALFGPLEAEEAEEPVQVLGPFTYRLAGDLALYEWGPALGIAVDEVDAATLGGWICRRLGRIPRAGDTLTWQGLHLRIERVERHRIRTLVVRVGQHG